MSKRVSLVLATAVAALAAVAGLAAAPVSAAPSPVCGSYAGTGNTTIGPFTLTGATVFYWRADGPTFRIQNTDLSSSWGVVDTTTAGSGATILGSGTYTLQIFTAGNWSISVPGGATGCAVTPPAPATTSGTTTGATTYPNLAGAGYTVVKVTAPTRVVAYWRTDGPTFRLTNVDRSTSYDVVDTTTAGWGATILPAGSYTLQVWTTGNWTLQFFPY